jgi:esterase/lipase superfamily enzyme
MHGRHKIWQICAALGLTAMLAACASSRPYTVNLMPAPAVYEETGITPFPEEETIETLPYAGVLYATLREPQPEGGDARPRFYSNERAFGIRVGRATISLGDADVTWEEARQVSLLKNRTEKYPLKVVDIDEFGVIFNEQPSPFLDLSVLPDDSREPGTRFAAEINDKLARSRLQDIYIYVHGFRVNFENPILVATELWHFLGYEGAFVAFSWPSSQNRLGYVANAESAQWSAPGFRSLLRFLADETDARRIHIVGYSAGTRMVAAAINQLALLTREWTEEDIAHRLRIGQVILVGSDVDRDLLATYLLDGFLRVTDQFTAYISEGDAALKVSRWLMNKERVGESFRQGLGERGRDYLLSVDDQLAVINVTDAEEAMTGNGHAYFRSSPWVSSDVLATMAYGFTPEERGLVRTENSPIWNFPPDYLQRLVDRIIKEDGATPADGPIDASAGAASQ